MFNEAPVRPSIHAKGRQASAIPAKTKKATCRAEALASE
mgnify:CR=1 FL=1